MDHSVEYTCITVTKILFCQISQKLLLRALASLKMGVTSGNKQHSTTGNSEGMMKALEELATFCDGQLRLKEEEGEGREGGRGGEGRGGEGRGERIRGGQC